MAANTKYKHFTFEDREVIAKGIENGSTKASLARVLGKDSSAIAKEIRKHRESYRKGRYPTQCRLFSRCPRKKTCQDPAIGKSGSIHTVNPVQFSQSNPA